MRALLPWLVGLGACAPARPNAPSPAAVSIDAPIPPGPPRSRTVVVVDSLLTFDRLRGALVTLDAASSVALTDGAGAAQFDSVAPGRHLLVVRHPLLDSIGVDTIAIPLRVRGDDSLLIATLPSPAAFMASRCAARRGAVADGVLVGVVRSADTDQPLPDVEVGVAWRGRDSAYAGNGMRARFRVRSNAQGQYTICHVPRFTPVELWAIDDKAETPRVRLQLGNAVLGAYDLSLDHYRAARDTASIISGGAGGPGATGMIEASAPVGSISGRIIMTNGEGLPNVTVQLDRPNISTTTDTAGRFTFPRVPAGVRGVMVRALGFRPSRIGLNLRPGQSVVREITLDRTAAVLGTVLVRATRGATWDSVGFEARKRRGNGYFLTNDDFKGTIDLSTALRMVPGISGRSSDRSQRLTAGRGAGCYPAFVINGVRFEGGATIGPDAMVRASDIRAIEVYPSRLSTPPEHQRVGDCAVIVVWLRDPQREREAAAAAARARRPGG